MRARRGVALMLVLWLVVVLGAVVAAVAGSEREDANAVVNARARVAARYAAESGVVAATDRIEAVLAGAPADAARAFRDVDQTLDPVREVDLGASRFRVALEDLNARLDLNMADDATLLAFFGAASDAATARRVVASLGDWKDDDDVAQPGGAEAADYARAGSPFVPANAPLARLAELRRVRGVTDALADEVAGDVTVDGDGRVNVNSASERVLAALPFVGAAGARAIVARRGAGQLFLAPTSIADVLGAAGGGAVPMTQVEVSPSRLLVVSRGWATGHPLTYEIQVVYAVLGTRLVRVSWKERDL